MAGREPRFLGRLVYEQSLYLQRSGYQGSLISILNPDGLSNSRFVRKDVWVSRGTFVWYDGWDPELREFFQNVSVTVGCSGKCLLYGVYYFYYYYYF